MSTLGIADNHRALGSYPLPGAFRLGIANVETVDRFWSKVEKGDGCWEWQSARSPRGYGAYHHGLKNGRILAHRYALIASGREIPPGLFVLHTCDNPPCVRPDHLYVGNHGDNMRDRAARHRTNAGSRNGMAKLNEADVRLIRAIYADGKSKYWIAKKAGVSWASIHRAVSGGAWSHVEP